MFFARRPLALAISSTFAALAASGSFSVYAATVEALAEGVSGREIHMPGRSLALSWKGDF